MPDLVGQSLGRYRILAQLGEGGMATVYKAYDTRLETDVAVKVIRTDELPPKALDRAMKRFEREAKSLARLTHPNIVKVTDYGEYEGMPFLVMTYLPGGTLKSKLGKPVPWQEATKILLPIARALDYAHRQNMIHRDVKPSNILITADGEPMLTDFGIAKILDLEATADLTGTGMGIGTPEYMAPEQWTGQATPQSDQYSLGVVLYEMIAGRKPYIADTPAAILLKQANDPLPRPSQFARGLPGKVEKLILKSLAKNPDDRYPSMGAFASALEILVIGEQSSVISRKGEAKQASQREQTRTMVAPVMEEKTARETPPIPFGDAKKQGLSALRYLPVVLVSVFVLIALALALNSLKPDQPALAETPTQAEAPLAVELPTRTMLPTTDTPAVVSIPEEITDSKGVTMRLVPAGTFTMGSETGGMEEHPVHEVYLDSYYMDVYEVTNKLYKVCVTAGVCAPPTSTGHYSNANYDDHPVVYVNWNMAKAYCEWRGAQLPTEAQWEKGARGADGRSYPWGEDFNCDWANYGGCVGDTTQVGSYPTGISPYRIYDMAGNVWEWVFDWYLNTFYTSSPFENPIGPNDGQVHVIRGGAWNLGPYSFLSNNRYWDDPAASNGAIGFRCARPVDSSTPLATPIPTQASLPEEIVDSQGVTMRLVPAGTFTMGSNDGEPDEQPVHDVYLDDYYMDVYEVTNKLYKVCVMAGGCAQPTSTGQYANGNYDNHPVAYVNWNMAKAYCEWRGAQLPTEAQWEKAARGTDGRSYPWGEDISCGKANYGQCIGATAPVGSYSAGISPYGLYDMSGNVWEWVADWYSETYYGLFIMDSPVGPNSGLNRVARGGSFWRSEDMLRTSARSGGVPTDSDELTGFRCARPADSQTFTPVTATPTP